MGRKQAVLAAAQCGGCVVVVGLMLRQIPLQAVLGSLAGARANWVLMSMALAVLGIFISSLKLWLILSSVRQARPLFTCWRAVLAAAAANVLLPAKGGDFVKPVFLRATGAGGLSTLMGAVLLERIVDVGTLGALMACGALCTGWSTGMWVAALIVACAVLGVAALALLHDSRRLPNKVRPATVPARLLLNNPAGMLLVFAAAVCAWLNNIMIFYALLASVGVRQGFAVVLAAAPAAILVGVVPVSISGIGTRDAALVWLLSPHAQPTAAFAAGMLYTACNYWLPALIGTVAVGHLAIRSARFGARVKTVARIVKAPGI